MKVEPVVKESPNPCCCATVAKRFYLRGEGYHTDFAPMRCSRRGKYTRWGRRYCWQHVKKAKKPVRCG